MYGENDNERGPKRGRPGPRGVGRAGARGLERRRPDAPRAQYGGMHDTHHWDGTPAQEMEHRRENYQTPGGPHPVDLPDEARAPHPAEAVYPEVPPIPIVDPTGAPQPPTPPRWRKKM